MFLELSDAVKSIGIDTGRLKVAFRDGREDKFKALDDLDAVIVATTRCLFSSHALALLAKENIIVTFCDATYHPSGILFPTVGREKQLAVMEKQVAASKPLKKKLWQTIIRTKILNQAKVCQMAEKQSDALFILSQKVRSGDEDNCEAHAARAYFLQLFGKAFFRRDDQNPLNGHLNFGYAIFRSQIARFVASAGLLPGFGVGHINKMNPFCLVDDLIEVYRPFIDWAVFKNNPTKAITQEDKAHYVSLLEAPIHPKSEEKLRTNMKNTVADVRRSFEEGKALLSFPNYLSPF